MLPLGVGTRTTAPGCPPATPGKRSAKRPISPAPAAPSASQCIQPDRATSDLGLRRPAKAARTHRPSAPDPHRIGSTNHAPQRIRTDLTPPQASRLRSCPTHIRVIQRRQQPSRAAAFQRRGTGQTIPHRIRAIQPRQHPRRAAAAELAAPQQELPRAPTRRAPRQSSRLSNRAAPLQSNVATPRQTTPHRIRVIQPRQQPRRAATVSTSWHRPKPPAPRPVNPATPATKPRRYSPNVVASRQNHPHTSGTPVTPAAKPRHPQTNLAAPQQNPHYVRQSSHASSQTAPPAVQHRGPAAKPPALRPAIQSRQQPSRAARSPTSRRRSKNYPRTNPANCARTRSASGWSNRVSNRTARSQQSRAAAVRP